AADVAASALCPMALWMQMFEDFVGSDPTRWNDDKRTTGRQSMKRRVFTQGFLFSLLCGPALAADPLPALHETPMFEPEVKSGALPPIAKRLPEQPWVVTKFAGGDGPGQ